MYVESSRFEKDKNTSEKYKEVIGNIEKARKNAAEKVRREICERNLSLRCVAKFVGVDAGGLLRRLHDKFSLPLDALPILCNTLLGESCHEVMFGCKSVTILPKHFAALAEKMMGMTDARRRGVYFAVAKVSEESRKNGLAQPYVSAREVLSMRIQEIADDKYVIPSGIFGNDAPSYVKAGLRVCSDVDSGHAVALSSIMYYAYALGTSMDYFVALDYAQVTPIAYISGNKVKIVRDPLIIQLISMCIRLPPEAQTKALASAWAYSLSEKKYKRRNGK